MLQTHSPADMAEEGNGDVEMAAEPAAMEDGSDSSSDDFEVDPQVEQRIMQLEAKLEAQPKDYDSHVQVDSNAYPSPSI